MFCYVCMQRFAPIVEGQSDEEKLKAFESNEIRCCEDEKCLEIVDAFIQSDDINASQRWMDEVREYLKKNPTTNRMEQMK